MARLSCTPFYYAFILDRTAELKTGQEERTACSKGLQGGVQRTHILSTWGARSTNRAIGAPSDHKFKKQKVWRSCHSLDVNFRMDSWGDFDCLSSLLRSAFHHSLLLKVNPSDVASFASQLFNPEVFWIKYNCCILACLESGAFKCGRKQLVDALQRDSQEKSCEC